MALLVLAGTLCISDATGKRTHGGFARGVETNRPVFDQHFGAPIFAGSLNVLVPEPRSLQADLDNRHPLPSFTIPSSQLEGSPGYLQNADAQIWCCTLRCDKIPNALKCWIFRRVGSRVPKGILEIVAVEALVEPYGLKNGDPVTLSFGR